MCVDDAPLWRSTLETWPQCDPFWHKAHSFHNPFIGLCRRDVSHLLVSCWMHIWYNRPLSALLIFIRFSHISGVHSLLESWDSFDVMLLFLVMNVGLQNKIMKMLLNYIFKSRWKDYHNFLTILCAIVYSGYYRLPVDCGISCGIFWFCHRGHTSSWINGKMLN